MQCKESHLGVKSSPLCPYSSANQLFSESMAHYASIPGTRICQKLEWYHFYKPNPPGCPPSFTSRQSSSKAECIDAPQCELYSLVQLPFIHVPAMQPGDHIHTGC